MSEELVNQITQHDALKARSNNLHSGTPMVNVLRDKDLQRRKKYIVRSMAQNVPLHGAFGAVGGTAIGALLGKSRKGILLGLGTGAAIGSGLGAIEAFKEGNDSADVAEMWHKVNGMSKNATAQEADRNAAVSDPILKRLALGAAIGIPASIVGDIAAKKLGRHLVGRESIKMLGENVRLHDLFGTVGKGLGLSGGMLAANKIVHMVDEKKGTK